MHTLRSPLVLSIVVVGLALARAASAVTCDVPMIAQQVAVPPNVMILVDNSGSMNEVMWHEDYDASIRYADQFDPDTVYYVSSAGDYTFNGRTARLVDGLHGQSGRYQGNYLNWLYYHATPTQRDAAPQVTRQMVANTAVKQVINSANGLRYGLARFNYSEGGTVVAPCGADRATLEYEVDMMEADTWTPSAEAMFTLLEYFADDAGPIQYSCQKNFVIFVTDGIPTKDTNVPSWIGDRDGDGNEPGSCASVGAPHMGDADCTDHLDDVAHYMAHEDLRSDLGGDQTVVTYTIGFGVDAPLLASTADNGRGLYRLAWNLETLIAELGTVVGDIVNRISSGAAVAVVSTETGTDDRLFRGKFMPGSWRGYLEAFELPYEPGEAPVWEAGTLLRDRPQHTRTLYANIRGSLVEFSGAQADALGLLMAPNGPGSGQNFEDGFGVDFDDDLVPDDISPFGPGPDFDQSYVRDLVEYVRGEEFSSFRDRDGWKLGDLVYSTPVVVGPPAGFHSDLDFHDFARDLEGRQPVVYVGANDGMLHAFDADDGRELWSYLPKVALPRFEEFADPDYCHLSLVDLSPRAWDVEIGGRWRTVLFGGQRTGGDSYFALDVTDPHGPELLWETRIPNMISSYTEPVLVETAAGPMLWVGSAPDDDGRSRASVIDASSGAILKNQVLGVIAGVNAATAPAAFDADFDGKADVVFQADLGGNVYRFDVRATDPAAWTFETVYAGSEPISARPALAVDFEQRLNVLFGTGRFADTSDFSTYASRRFVCLVDPTATVTTADLVDRTNDHAPDDFDEGWFVRLENGPGERVTETAVVLEGVVYFTSFAPSSAPCSSGGDSWLYRIDLDGGAPIDRDEDGELDDEERSESLGSGIASRPVVNLPDEELIVQTSDARLNVEELSLSPQRVIVRAWRERYDGQTAQQQDPDDGGTN